MMEKCCSIHECAKCDEAAGIQPADDVEWYQADGVFIKQMHIKKKDTMIPQHSHEYDHTSMLATGSVRIWRAGQLIGERVAPAGIFISAGTKHAFQSLEDNTIIYCIHNVSRAGKAEIREEHQFSQGSH